jgi:hypothetical protein
VTKTEFVAKVAELVYSHQKEEISDDLFFMKVSDAVEVTRKAFMERAWQIVAEANKAEG